MDNLPFVYVNKGEHFKTVKHGDKTFLKTIYMPFSYQGKSVHLNAVSIDGSKFYYFDDEEYVTPVKKEND